MSNIQSYPSSVNSYRVPTPYAPFYLPLVVDGQGQRYLPLNPLAEILGVSISQEIMPMTDYKFWQRQTVMGWICVPVALVGMLFGKIKPALVQSDRRQFLTWCQSHGRMALALFHVPDPVTPMLVEEPEPCPGVVMAKPTPSVAPMETGLQTFSFGSAPVRVVMKDGEPWWIASDVCAVLDLGNSRQALTRLDEDEKGVISNDTPGGRQEMATVSESGLYSLVLGSRKPEAKSFKRWITHEVIPAIRKTGSYGIQQFKVPQTLREALLLAADQQGTIEAQQATIATLEPKAQFTDRVTNSKDAMTIREFAKILGTGQNRLFQWLRLKGYLIPGTTEPYQNWVDQGLFIVIELAFEDAHGCDRTSSKTKITGKGQTRIQREWDEDNLGGEAS